MREGTREREMKWALPLAAFCLRAFLCSDDVMRTGPGQTGPLMLFGEEGPHSFTSPRDRTIYHFHTARKYVCRKRSSDTNTLSVCVCVCALLCNTRQEFSQFSEIRGAFLSCFRLLSWLFDSLNIRHCFPEVWHYLSKKRHLKYRSHQLSQWQCKTVLCVVMDTDREIKVRPRFTFLL